MKNNKILAGLFATALITPACSDEFLEIEKPDGEPLEEYYTNEKTLMQSLAAAYDPLQWPDWDGVAYNALTCDAEILGDDFWVGGEHNNDNKHWHMLFNFEGDGNNTLATLWTDFYSGVKRCNDAIKYVGWNRGKINDKTLDSIEMQARLLRIYYYNIMWHYYGNIPFYLSNLTVPYVAPQKSADEIYASLIDELENTVIASKALPMKWGALDCGRVSQAMAYMLYAEMVMYQNDTDRFPTALSYMNEIIKSGDYALNPDYANIWEESGEWSNESIFEINYNDDNAQRDWGPAKACGGTVLPTLISPNSFPGGTELHSESWSSGKDGWGFLPLRVETYNMFEEGDVRREATCWDLRYMPYEIEVLNEKGKKETITIDYNKRYQDTHLWLNKYRPKDETCKDCPTSQNLNYNNNLRIYRYSETLLNAAELIVRGAGSGDAKSLLNQVRERAGLDGTDATLDNIIKERHYEFVGEGKRYFDLVRMVGVSESSANAENTLVPNEYRKNSWTKSKKHIPLAQSELDADPSLVQNNY